MASDGMVRMVDVVVVARLPAHSLRYVTTPITTPISVATTMHWKTALAC